MSVATVAAVASVAATGASMYQSAKAGKANKANQEAFNKATIENEKEARKLFDTFINQYNESKEKLLEGMTLEQYVGNIVGSLNNKELEKAYRNARTGDWEMAQKFADEATDQNVSTFQRIMDTVSEGAYTDFIKTRNKAVLSEDAESLYREARRLQSPKQSAGSVVRDADGNPISGQRGDKIEFKISETAIREQNDRTFAKASQAIESDRAAGARQQERAISFLPSLNFAEMGTNVGRQYTADKLQAELSILGQEASLAAQAMGGAISSPAAPPMVDTASYDRTTQESSKQAIAALSDLYRTNKQQQQVAAASSSTVSSGNPYLAGDLAFRAGYNSGSTGAGTSFAT